MMTTDVTQKDNRPATNLSAEALVAETTAGRRKMEYPFGWIPQRFVTDGIMKTLRIEEILLYIFLSLVSDKNGISWYGDKRISELTGIPAVGIITARFGLEKKGFIAYKKPYYQVLQMPRSISCT